MKTKINDITVNPVKKYAAPKYPTREAAADTPKLLHKLPKRWEKNAAVIAAVGMLGAMSLNSCGIGETKAGYNPGSESYLNVAPVFIHGEGTGSMGCVMIAPSVFLSEEEALAIIKNEAKIAGLNFTDEVPEYNATNNKPKDTSQYSWLNPKYVLGEGYVRLDLYDKQTGVAAAFISMGEAAVIYDGMESSVTGYGPRELAELSAEDFARQNGDIAVGVFYDPGKNWEDERQQQILEEYNNSEKEWDEKRAQYENDTKAIIEEDLRAQIRDFIEWLQGQGVI
jgi:hypothetical protein